MRAIKMVAKDYVVIGWTAARWHHMNSLCTFLATYGELLSIGEATVLSARSECKFRSKVKIYGKD